MAIAEDTRVAGEVARQAARRSRPDRRAAVSFGALAALVAALTALAYARGAWGYVDNGDGYYLYAARRVAEGAALYRDVLGTQPPLVYLLGALAFKLGATLHAMRLLSAAMRALTVGLVFLLGRRLFGSGSSAALASLLYALLPIGLAWDRSFDVNPPLTLVALLGAVALSRLTPPSACLAGLLAALALFTKNLYLPLLAATLAYLILRRRPLLAPYLQGLGAGTGILGAILVARAGPTGLHDAFLGQGASPANAAWFVASLYYVVTQEGAPLLAALIGLYLLMRKGRPRNGRFSLRRGERLRRSPLLRRSIAEGRALRTSHPCEKPTPKREGHHRELSCARDYAPYLFAGSAAVLLATVKEGTFGTVFQFAEPAVSLLAAYALVSLARQVRGVPADPPPLGPLTAVGFCGRGERLRCSPLPEERESRKALPSAPPVRATNVSLRALGRRHLFTSPAADSPREAIARQAALRDGRDARSPRKRLLALALLAWIAWASLGILRADAGTLASYGSAGNAGQVRRIAAIVRAHARPGEAVLLPPYYAVLTGTRLPFDAADTYIVAQRAQRGDPTATHWMRSMARAVAARRYPVVVTDDRIAAYAPVMAALRTGYHPVYADTLPPALHAVVWLPN